MRAFYYLFFILFNNLLSIHIHKCVEKFVGGLAPQAPDERRLCSKTLHLSPPPLGA